MQGWKNRIGVALVLALGFISWPLAAWAQGCYITSHGDYICDTYKAPQRQPYRADTLPTYRGPQAVTTMGQRRAELTDLSLKIEEFKQQAIAAAASGPSCSPSEVSGSVMKVDFENVPLGKLSANDMKNLTGPGWYSNAFGEGRVSAVRDDAKHGTAMEVVYDGGVYGGSHGAQFKNNIGSHDELYLSYDLKFASNFDFVKGGKMPGLCGGTCPAGGKDASGGYSTRLMFKGKGHLVLYLYHPGQKGKYADSYSLKFNAKPGEWFNVTERVNVQTGEVQVWINGEEKIHLKGLRLPGKIDTFLFSTFFGGNTNAWATSKQERSYFDNIHIYKGSGAPVC